MIKKDIKMYLKEKRKIKREKLNNWMEEYERTHKEEILTNKLTKDKYPDDAESLQLKKEIYVLTFFELTVSETKYKESGIKLMKKDFTEITPQVLDDILERVCDECLSNFEGKKEMTDVKLRERVIRKILFYYHDYTGFEDGKYGKF